MAAAPDYRMPRCAGHGCPHRIIQETQTGDGAYRKRITIPCRHFHSSGEPAAPWARTNKDGTCPHYQERTP